MHQICLTGATVWTDRTARRVDVAIDDGRIAAVGHDLPAEVVIRVDELYLAPGLIDLHLNGGMSVDFTSRRLEAMPAFEQHLLATGVTAYLAALNTDTVAGRRAAVAATAETVGWAEPGRPACLGFYLEGPYYNAAQRGAHDATLMRDPDPPEAEQVVSAIREHSPEAARIVWSSAPERDPDGAFLQWLLSQSIVPALGHSDATFEQIEAAADAGARLVTHVYSCLTSFTGAGSTKQLGGNEGALFRDDLLLEVIADHQHLTPTLLAWIAKVAGLPRLCLTTDAMAAAGLGDGVYEFLEQEVRVEQGRAYREDRTHFAGSTATLPQCLRNLAATTGAPPAEVVATATEVPAKLLGLTDRGRIAAGCRADLVMFGPDWEVVATIIGGDIAFQG